MILFYALYDKISTFNDPEAEPHGAVANIQDLRTGGRWLNSKIDDSHCDRIHCSLTVVHCFENGFFGKQPVDVKKYCAECW